MNDRMEPIRDAREAAIDRILEQSEPPVIPPDFAARVMAALPPAPKPRRKPQLARTAAFAAAVVLVVATFLLAPRLTPSFNNAAFYMELLLLVQLALIALWLAVKRPV
jgi:hypothetical protein